jgi:hypothetical protein
VQSLGFRRYITAYEFVLERILEIPSGSQHFGYTPFSHQESSASGDFSLGNPLNCCAREDCVGSTTEQVVGVIHNFDMKFSECLSTVQGRPFGRNNPASVDPGVDPHNRIADQMKPAFG